MVLRAPQELPWLPRLEWEGWHLSAPAEVWLRLRTYGWVHGFSLHCGLGSFFQPGQGPRSHPSALSSQCVMAHPSSTKQCCASPRIQWHRAQPSSAAGCTQQGKEGWSRASLPASSSFSSPSALQCGCSQPSQLCSPAGIPFQARCRGRSWERSSPARPSLGHHPCPCCPQEPCPCIPVWWNRHPKQSSTSSHGTCSCGDSRGPSSSPHPHLMSSFPVPCLGYPYPKEPYTLFVSISPAPLTMATLPGQWEMPTASSQAVCAWDVLSSPLGTFSRMAIATPCMNWNEERARDEGC